MSTLLFLILLTIFRWYECFDEEILNNLVKDNKYNLQFKIVEILTNSRYHLHINDFFFYSIISFIYKIFKYVEPSFLNQIFENLDSNDKKIFLSKLCSQINDKNTDNISNEIVDYRNFKNLLYEVWKYLSNHYELKGFN